MDRRDFLKTAGTATAAVAAGVTEGVTATATSPVAAPALGRDARQWVLAVPQSLDTREVRTVVARLQHQITASLPRTSVILETTVCSGMEAVSTGLADIYIGIDSQHDAAHPALPVFAGLALGHDMSAAAHRAWLEGPGKALWTAALNASDVVAMPVAHTGPSPGLYTDVAFETGQDVRGLQIGARGFAANALRLLGANVSTGDADGLGALAGRGLVAAEPLMTPFETKAQWAYQPGLTSAGLSISLGARGSFWRRLSASEQALIAGIARDVSAASLELVGHRKESLDQVAAFRRWPMHTVMPSAFERDVREAITAVIDDLAASDALARRAIESVRQFAARVG